MFLFLPSSFGLFGVLLSNAKKKEQGSRIEDRESLENALDSEKKSLQRLLQSQRKVAKVEYENF